MLIQLYQSAWCFCLPSLYEGFGVPYIEAMACGTPVVASPNPGSLEVTRNGLYGIITDFPTLGDKLVNLLNDGGQQRELASSALEHVQDFDIDKVAKRYIEYAVRGARL
jgi:glycosyltransferase involved in cell wall biosynthesis